VLSDLVDIAAGRIPCTFGRPVAALRNGSKVVNGGGPDTPFYVRLMVVDKPGVLADVTSVLQTHAISVESLLQQGRAPQDVVALVMTTHEVSVDHLMKALDELESLSCVQAPPVAMPIVVADQEG
jgi:homoserine dehydrogenase